MREHWLKVFENRVLRRIFGRKRDEIKGKWRKLHNEEDNDLYCSPYIFRVIKSRRKRWAGQVARVGERRRAYKLLVGKPE
jgi:PAS domain-containing protein